MTLAEFILLLAVGRLCIWFLQTATPLEALWRSHRWLTSLGQCDLCLGFWVYLFLAYFLPAYGLWPWPVELIITAAVCTLTMHLLRLGWQAKFSTVIVE